MSNSANVINATFGGANGGEISLFQIKKAHEKSIERLEHETAEKRKQLAARLWNYKKLARRIGYDSGLKKAGLQTASLINTAKEHYEKSVSQAEKDCLSLAVRIAKEILQAEITVNSKALLKRIKSGIETLHETENLKISVNAAHVSELKDLFKAYPGQVRIVSDENTEPGNAVIETENGCIDINWKTQLDIIHRLLTNKIQHANKL